MMTDGYKKEMCGELQKVMGDGGSLTDFAKQINVSLVSVYRWLKKYPEFSEAYRDMKPMQGSYKPEYCELVVKMMKDGASVAEVASEIGVTLRTIMRWVKEYEDFGSAYELARTHCEAWWIRTGKNSLYKRDFNTKTWYFNMKNRFGWRDMREHQVSGNIEIGVKKVVLMDNDDNGIETDSRTRIPSEGSGRKTLSLPGTGSAARWSGGNGQEPGNG